MKLDIVIATAGIEFNGNSINEKALGGSESAVIYVARALAKMGHNVDVFCKCDNPGIYENVKYYNIDNWNQFVLCGECDILIVSRFLDLFKNKINSKLNILWNHDILVDKDMLMSVIYNIDYMYCLSDFHKKQYLQNLPELESIIKIIPNGIDSEILINYKEKKHKIMYTSRPERGLYRALQIYEKLGDKDLEFMICTYQSINDPKVDKITSICLDYMARLGKIGYNIKLANFNKKELYENLAESKAVIYPTEFPEIFCISAIEAQGNGTAFISTNGFALVETGHIKIDNPEQEDIYNDNFIVELKKQLKNKKTNIDKESIIKKYNWDNIAKKIIDDAILHFEIRSKNTQGIINKFIYESDIVAARELIQRKILPSKNMVDVNYLEKKEQIDNMLRFVDGKESLKEIYENEKTHEKIDLDLEAMEQNTRFKWLSQQIQDNKIEKILDYACHMGWATILSSNRNPNCRITGYDISEKAIEKAKIRIKKYAKYPDNIFFTNNEDDLKKIKYDAIFIGEYLEHVLDPIAELSRLENMVRSGGKIFITVPKGAWEKLSHLENMENDVYYHVNCFDKNDIRTMLGHRKDFKMNIIHNMIGMYGERLGNYLIKYTKDDLAIRNRDLGKKYLLTRPYAGISACIIAKDAEKEIERMLDSINYEVDEIIIGLDHKQNENKELERRIGKYKKVKIIYLEKSIQAPDYWGFSNARNYVVKQAKNEWIFWIDTDEILLKQKPFRQFLDSDFINGYIISQHHVQFDNFIEADSPMRLYRKNKGEFFGYIHEQVQDKNDINESIMPALIMTGAHILNFGETTELIRRNKALNRNLKLLEMDVAKNVDERKKAGLPIRKLSIILLMRDFYNRICWAQEKYQALRCKDIDEMSIPMIEKLYDKYFKNEKNILYKELAEKIKQEAYLKIGIGKTLEIKLDEKVIAKKIIKDLNQNALLQVI